MGIQMQYKSLKYMLALQEERVLATAAKQLDISQSSLSLFLLRLEEEAGTPLYDRKMHCMTKAGELYCDGARKILNLHDKAMDDIKTRPDSKAILFGADICISEIVPSLINSLLEKIAMAYPQLRLQVSFLPEARLRDLIQQKKLDLAFSYFQRSGIDNLRRREIMAETFILVVPKGFKPYKANPFTALNSLKYISMFRDTSIRSACDALLFVHGISPFVQIESGSYAFTQSLMETGSYTTIIPSGAVGLFERFDLYPLESEVQAVSGFYLHGHERETPQFLCLMDVFEQLLHAMYTESCGIHFPGGTSDEPA